MKRGVKLIPVLAGAALTLLLAALGLLLWLPANGSPALAANAIPVATPGNIAVPTISAGSAASISPAAPSMGNIPIAATLTCVTTSIGLIIAVATLTILLRGGYGPFLRALIFGSKVKAEKRRKQRGKGREASAESARDQWDASRTLNYQPGPGAHEDPFAAYPARDAYDGYDAFDAYDGYDQSAASRRGPGSRGSSRSHSDSRRDGGRADRADRGGRSGASTRSRGGSSRRGGSRDDWG